MVFFVIFFSPVCFFALRFFSGGKALPASLPAFQEGAAGGPENMRFSKSFYLHIKLHNAL
jgi:hypothetical protein